MQQHLRYLPLILAISYTAVPAPAPAADKSAEQQWRDQETWSQFVDKEHSSSFKASKPKSKPEPKTQSELEKLATPSRAPSQSSGINSYVLMPGTQATPPPPTLKVETEVVPVPGPQTVYPTVGGWGGWGWGRTGYWGNPFHYGGPYSGWGSPGVMIGPGPMSFRKQTKFTQIGPSKASGNYYNPSTPDPTAAGNYYASPTPAPKAAPVIQQDQPPADNWGKGGNPLPEDMQPK